MVVVGCCVEEVVFCVFVDFIRMKGRLSFKGWFRIGELFWLVDRLMIGIEGMFLKRLLFE